MSKAIRALHFAGNRTIIVFLWNGTTQERLLSERHYERLVMFWHTLMRRYRWNEPIRASLSNMSMRLWRVREEDRMFPE